MIGFIPDRKRSNALDDHGMKDRMPSLVGLKTGIMERKE